MHPFPRNQEFLSHVSYLHCMKKIAVIGPIPRDYIITHQSDLIQKWGGIAHPVIGLARLAEGKMEIIPVAHVRKVDLDNIHELLSDYNGVTLTHLTTANDQGDVISLRFIDMNNREERQTGFMDPILPGDMKELLKCDVFVFVPVSDYQVSLETVRYLKANSKGTIIFDAHGPTTACLVDGRRIRKFWVDRDLWLPYIDVLKMNMEEAKVTWFKKEYETKDFSEAELERNEIQQFAQHCLDRGVRCVVVTMDSRGCLVYFKNKGKVVEHWEPSIKVNSVVDTTGCGDSFAGGLAYGLSNDPVDYIKAAKYGNALGAMRTQGKTFDVFKSLDETNTIIEAGHL